MAGATAVPLSGHVSIRRCQAPRVAARQQVRAAAASSRLGTGPSRPSPSLRFASSRPRLVVRASDAAAQPGPAGAADEATVTGASAGSDRNMPLLFASAFRSASMRLGAIGKRLAAPVGGLSGLTFGLTPITTVGLTVGDLTSNIVFMSAVYSWFAAQILKIFTKYARTRSWDWRVLFDSGGMPSSHTALVVGLTAAIALQHGLNSTLFPLSLAFSLVVMYDAAGVRRHAGKQAEVLNALVEDYFQGHPVAEQELKEVIGHTPLQVAMGAVLGVATSILYRKYLV